MFGLGADLGVNVLLDSNLLVGVEGDLAWLNNDSYEGQIHGKLGLGAEVALADNLSLKAEYQYQYDFDNSSEDAHVAKIGFNWHF